LLADFPCGVGSPNPSAAQPGVSAPAVFLGKWHRLPEGPHFSIHAGKANMLRKAAANTSEHTQA